MDNLTLAQKLLGKEKTTEYKSELVNPSSASIVYMIAVTASSGGEVVLRDEIDETAEWEDGDFTEVDEDGGFIEYESEDDPMEDVDDSVVDMTDGDGVDIEGTAIETVSFSVAAYHEAAVAAYEEEAEGEVIEDDLPDEDTTIDDTIDDGDAVELPDDGETSIEDDLPDEDVSVDEISDDDYTLTDDNSDDESDEPITGAEISDGYTVADCIGSIKAGDRVAVMIQDGKITVLGVVGAGDEQEALALQAQEAADAASKAAENAQEKADAVEGLASEAAQDAADAKQYAEEAKESAMDAQTAANQAATEAAEATQKAIEAATKADAVEENMADVVAEVDSVKEDAVKMREELEGQIDTKITEATATFATKTEVSAAETTLRSEFQESIAGIQLTFGQDYAKKTELEDAVVNVTANLQSQITANANLIQTTVSSLESMQTDITSQDGKIAAAQQAATDAQNTANQAKTDAEEAQTAANQAKTEAEEAQTAAGNAQNEANSAKSKADEAQALADAAKKDLATAEAKLAEVESLAGSNQEAVEQAQAAVEQAQEAVNTAQAAADKAKQDAATAQTTANQAKTDASNANTAAGNAQAKADEAKTAADKAQEAADEAKEDLAALNDRVVQAETTIQQHSEAIALRATKTELQAVNNNLSNNYYTKTQTDAEIKEMSDSITLSVSSVQSEVEKVQGQLVTTNNAVSAAEARIKICEDNINSQVSVTDGLTTRMSSVEQTAQGLTVSLSTTNNNVTAAANAAANAKTAADTAQSTANTARTEAANAAKTATNFMSYDATNGLLIGNKSNGSWSGSRAQILPSAFNILDSSGVKLAQFGTTATIGKASGKNIYIDSDSVDVRNATTVLSSFTEDAVYLGKNNRSSTIDLCNGVGKIYNNVYDDPMYNRMVIESEHEVSVKTTGRINLTGVYYHNNNVYTSSALAMHAYTPWDSSDGFFKLETIYSNSGLYRNSYISADYYGLVLHTYEETTDYNDSLMIDMSLYYNIIEVYGNTHFNNYLSVSDKVMTGDKKLSGDGVEGSLLSATGRLYLQYNAGDPAIHFMGKGQTSYGARISYNVTDDQVSIDGAKLYVGGSIESTGTMYPYSCYADRGFRMGNDQVTTSAAALSTYWTDGSAHNIVERQSDGLTASFGWAGSSSYATIAKIRGRTCQYQNASGTTALSDERLKDDFVSLDRWDSFFDTLEPFAFKMKNGNSGRYHFGFKAQQFEKALLDNGLTTQDSAAFVRMVYEPDEDDPEGNAIFEAAGIKAGDYYYGIIYTELTPLNTYQIQMLKTEIKVLKEEVAALKNVS